LSIAVRARSPGGVREHPEAALPLVLGFGAGAAFALADASLPERAAVIGRRQGRFYLQAVPGFDRLRINGEPLAGGSAWLAPGDQLAIGDERWQVEVAGELLELVDAALAEAVTAPPVLLEPEAAPARLPAEGDVLEAAPFRRAAAIAAPERAARPWKLKAAAGAIAAALFAAAAFVFTATPVRIEVSPPPEQLALRGGLLIPMPGGRFLVRPGAYSVSARLSGYAALEEGFEVRRDGAAEFRFELARLPDVYAIRTGELDGARVFVDGEPAGATPLSGLELAPGRYALRIEAELHRPYHGELLVEGGGREIALDIELALDRGELVVESSPAGARVLADGVELGVTPLAAQLASGRYAVEVTHPGHVPWSGEVNIEPDGRVVLPPLHLEPAGGRLRITSEPAGASVLVGGQYRGLTPLELELPPGRAQRIELRKSGFERAARSVTVASGAEERWSATLEPLAGEAPPAAAPERPAAPAPAAAAPPERIRTSQGVELVRVRPGRFTIGASRREPGRRANENLREVELTRGFHIATTPVTNGQFAAFNPAHRSGEAGRYSLNGERQPVVRVSWEQAVEYCNWLSAKEGLRPAYRKVGERWEPVLPRTGGYRLPTEAEWAWAARYAGRPGEPPRYPWGAALPPPERSGNYADESARTLLGAVIPRYEDGFAASSPVGSFPANLLGLHDIGGNVAEWMEDFYGVYPPSGELLVDPRGPATGRFRVIRGSSWMHHGATELRLSYRDYGNEPRPDVGFRLVRDLE
jgi:formylglycine-generating enzyme required for sulfatase activity